MKELTLFNNAEFFSVSLQRLTQKNAYKKEHFKHITETVLMPINSSTNALIIDFRRSGVRSPESLARRFVSCDLSEQCHAATSDGYYFLLDAQTSYIYTLEISTRTLEVSRLPSLWTENYMRTRQEAAPLRGLITSRLSTARQLTLIDYDDEKSITEQYKEMQAELETLRAENKKLREENELLAEESDTEIVSERVSVQSELELVSDFEQVTIIDYVAPENRIDNKIQSIALTGQYDRNMLRTVKSLMTIDDIAFIDEIIHIYHDGMTYCRDKFTLEACAREFDNMRRESYRVATKDFIDSVRKQRASEALANKSWDDEDKEFSALAYGGSVV